LSPSLPMRGQFGYAQDCGVGVVQLDGTHVERGQSDEAGGARMRAVPCPMFCRDSTTARYGDLKGRAGVVVDGADEAVARAN
jgi:hypothetical protein